MSETTTRQQRAGTRGRMVTLRVVLTGAVVLAQVAAVLIAVIAVRSTGLVAAAIAVVVASTVLAVGYEIEETRSLWANRHPE